MTMLAELVGCQVPRVRSVPPSVVSLGEEAVDFAAQAGLVLDEWQRVILRDSMGVAAGGRWVAPQVGLLVPRQNGKGSILEARELFGMFVLGESLIIHSAHKFDTSQEHFLRMRNLIDGNADLSRHVKSVLTANGKESITLNNGNRLKFKARTISGSGRGFSADLLVLDESMLLPEQALDAMLPTLITRPNPQTWFTSSAGTADSAALWRIVKRGRAGAPRLAYFEWGCESGADPLDRANWAAANPALNIHPEHGIRLAALEDDLGQMSEDGFAREHLGMWDDQAAEAIFDLDAWAAAADPSEVQSGAATYAVATAPDREWTCVAAAWRRADGVPQVSVVRYAKGTAWVPDLLASFGSVPLLDAASRGLVPGAVEPSLQDQAQAHNLFADAVVAGQVRHDDEAELNVSVRAARWRPLGDTRVLDRKGTADISPLAAVALALWGMRQPDSYDVTEAIW